jgi:hypothetical protein
MLYITPFYAANTDDIQLPATRALIMPKCGADLTSETFNNAETPAWITMQQLKKLA